MDRDREFIERLERELRASGAIDAEIAELLRYLEGLSKLPIDRTPPASRPRTSATPSDA